MSDYSRGHSKGYAAGMRRGYRFMKRLTSAAKALRERAQRAESGAGLGTCQNCSLWEREVDCQWGYCHMGNALDLETPWMGLAERTDNALITTHENFGCVRFSASAKWARRAR